jgi:NADH-quinone oxidoreductase subunit L
MGLLMVIVGRVYMFGYYYMRGELKMVRFFWVIRLFVVSMILLVFFPHIVFVFVGYDGLGIVRFILVVYYRRGSR